MSYIIAIVLSLLYRRVCYKKKDRQLVDYTISCIIVCILVWIFNEIFK